MQQGTYTLSDKIGIQVGTITGTNKQLNISESSNKDIYFFIQEQEQGSIIANIQQQEQESISIKRYNIGGGNINQSEVGYISIIKNKEEDETIYKKNILRKEIEGALIQEILINKAERQENGKYWIIEENGEYKIEEYSNIIRETGAIRGIVIIRENRQVLGNLYTQQGDFIDYLKTYEINGIQYFIVDSEGIIQIFIDGNIQNIQ